MGRQSSRLYFQGKDHKDIYFRGHYHDAMYLTDSEGNATLVWEKLKTEEGVEFIPWGINYYGGLYFVLENVSNGSLRNINLYTGKSLTTLKLRFSETTGIGSGYYLYFIDCDECGLQYAFGTHPQEYRGDGTAIGKTTSYYRRIPNIEASDYQKEITDIPNRIIQCKNFGVIFDTKGNFYYCYSSNVLIASRGVIFYKGEKTQNFKNETYIPYVDSEPFAQVTLPVACAQSIGFLVKDKIAVCCAPKDTVYYNYDEVMEKPFYVCSVSVTGDGSDISVDDIGNKRIVYSNSASKYVPMGLRTSIGYRISMLTENIGHIEVSGTLKSLIVDFYDCKIISALSSLNPYRSITYAYKFNDIYYVMIRDYYSSNDIIVYSLFYGNELSESDLNKCIIITDNPMSFRNNPQLYYASCVYSIGDILTAFNSSPARMNPLQLNLKTGNYKEIEIITKYI